MQKNIVGGIWARDWLLCEEVTYFLFSVYKNYIAWLRMVKSFDVEIKKKNFFNECQGQDFDSHSFAGHFFFLVGCDGEFW